MLALTEELTVLAWKVVNITVFFFFFFWFEAKGRACVLRPLRPETSVAVWTVRNSPATALGGANRP